MDKCVGAAIAIREHGATRFEDMTASFFCEERRSLFVLFVFPFPMPREVGNGIFYLHVSSLSWIWTGFSPYKIIKSLPEYSEHYRQEIYNRNQTLQINTIIRKAWMNITPCVECSVIGGQGIKSALDYREVGLYIIPGDSRHILKLP